jgi:3-oxoacyl-[acyl-carrier-protein] synthase II
MSKPRPVIVGMDAVSPLGLDLEVQWQRALEGRSGVGPLTRFPLAPGFPVAIAGQVAPIDHLDYPFLKPREQARWISPIFKYALLTVTRALADSGIQITPDLAPRVAVTFSSAIGGLDAVLAADRRLMGQGRLPAPAVPPNACINMVGGRVSMHTGATGPISATVTACATGATSMAVGAMWMAQGLADVVICGAVDFPLVEPIVAGFATMGGAYVPADGAVPEPPEAASRPFSLGRRGFVVAEGAACTILATSDFARAHGLRQDIELAGWAMTSDAHHFVAPHLPTVARCMAGALADAGIGVRDVAAVNAHAASTRAGDLVEAEALRQVFSGQVPPVTANKSLIGHAMGASSAIETVLAVQAMRAGRLPPTLNHRRDPAIGLEGLSAAARILDQPVVLKNAFGFGGCNTCLVLRRRA